MAVLVPGGMAEAMKLAFDRVAVRFADLGERPEWRRGAMQINYGI